jgi:hypothetical protein
MKPTILGRDFMLATIQAPKVEKEPEAVKPKRPRKRPKLKKRKKKKGSRII